MPNPFDNDYISDDEDDHDSVIDEIYNEDIDHAENEKEQYKYYIGITKLIRPDYYYLLLNSISSNMFFRYPYRTVLNYLSEYSIIETYKPQIDILKLTITDDVYTVIKKTHWIRLIQRHWKKVLQNRYELRLRRGSILSQKTFEMTGKYPSGLRVLPGLYGMLSKYKTNYADNVVKYKN
jgi:hypothetical protein